MQVLNLSYSDIKGGGGFRAAYRLHKALRMFDIDSFMRVNVSASNDWTVFGPQSKLLQVFAISRAQFIKPFTALCRTKNPILHSPALLPSHFSNWINKSDFDIVHLHWVQGEMISIEDVSRIRKPIVWTLHDMWTFCGAEHLAWDERWKEGYFSSNRPSHENGLDINRMTWSRKKKYWNHPMTFIAPSQWMKECADQSALLHKQSTYHIPNPIDTTFWSPVPREFARISLNLPQNVPIILFGAVGKNPPHHKGFDLLLQALAIFSKFEFFKTPHIVIFGQSQPKEPLPLSLPIHYVGHFQDEVSMKLLYASADCVAIPSRFDNLPNIAVESICCGTPVVSFDVGGLSDIVKHKQNGYVAKSFNVDSFAHGIYWILSHKFPQVLRHNARSHAVNTFSSDLIIPRVLDIYKSLVHY